MKKPDYKGFVLHIREWERIGISYGVKELRELASKYDCPIINTRTFTSDELIKVKKEFEQKLLKEKKKKLLRGIKQWLKSI